MLKLRGTKMDMCSRFDRDGEMQMFGGRNEQVDGVYARVLHDSADHFADSLSLPWHGGAQGYRRSLAILYTDNVFMGGGCGSKKIGDGCENVEGCTDGPGVSRDKLKQTHVVRDDPEPVWSRRMFFLQLLLDGEITNGMSKNLSEAILYGKTLCQVVKNWLSRNL